MSFVRPQAQAALWRWREVLIGGALAALGLWGTLGAHSVLFWISPLVCAGGAALVAVGVPRGLFRDRHNSPGPGVVQIVEGRVSYFGPLTGGTIDLTEITRLAHDARGYPAHWEMTAADQPPLHIPVTATGADVLFDAFQTLPGLSTPKLLAARGHSDGYQIVWQRSHPRPFPALT